jgi:hypothetical protein
MKEIKYTNTVWGGDCVFVRTFVITFYCGSGTVINYGSGSGSNFLTSNGSGSGSTRQKVTVVTVPVSVPRHCLWPCIPFLTFRRGSGSLLFFALFIANLLPRLGTFLYVILKCMQYRSKSLFQLFRPDVMSLTAFPK